MQNLPPNVEQVARFATKHRKLVIDDKFVSDLLHLIAKDKEVTGITQNSPFRELCGSQDSAMVTPPGVEPGLQA